jgi:hypothetical protein
MTSTYICSTCGCSHVKLWRLYSSTPVELKCAKCLIGDEAYCLTLKGQKVNERGALSVSITANHVPAVYDTEVYNKEGVFEWWGALASTIPQVDVDNWENLPNSI